MVNPIFPEKTDESMSDRDWETYCIQVWCCNSLNAKYGVALHEKRDSDARMFERAQTVINFLLKETGRV